MANTLALLKRTPNLKKLAAVDMVGMHFIDAETTYFENVFRLPGANVMTVDQQGINKSTYWTPDPSHELQFKDEDNYVEAFQDLFSRVIADRLRGAFPVVSLLSGGLDSSAIVGMAAHLLGQQQKALTTLSAVMPPGYGGKMTDERNYIDAFSDQANIDMHYVSDAWRGPFDGLEDPILNAEHPDRSSRHYQYSAFADAAVRCGARTILDGCYGELGPSFHGGGYLAELLVQGRIPIFFQGKLGKI